MPSPLLIRNAAWVVAWDARTKRHVYQRNIDLFIAEGRIAALEPHRPNRIVPETTAVMAGERWLVLPGLINLHAHPSTALAARGVREDHGVPAHGRSGLYERMQAFSLDAAGQAAGMRLAYAEMMACGVTTVVDLSPPFAGWLAVMRESGLRVWAGPPFAEAHWAMTEPQRVEWVWDRGRGRAAFATACALMHEAETDPCGRLQAIVHPAQIDTVSEELLREAYAFAQASGRPFTTHIAQSPVEVQEMLARHGLTPIQWAANIGLLGPRTILGHAVFIDEHPAIGLTPRRDLTVMAEAGVTVAHCPTPFALYGHHLADYGRYRARGIGLGLGTDCAPHNLIEEMRLALILARNAAGDLEAADTASVFHAATVGGAEALGRPELGRIAVGAAADLVLVDLDHPLMSPPRDPLRSWLFHAADRAIRRVIVGGETVFADGKPCFLDTSGAAACLAEAQARMLAQARSRDYRRRHGDAVAPLALPIVEVS